jgi:hypothetical protein
MSRSRKKSPIVKDPANKGMKRLANKKVRRTNNIPSGKAYKKVFESWDISDYRWIWTKEDAIDSYMNEQNSRFHKRHETLEEYLKYWEKCVKRK